jgi:hypothetical protein
VAHQLESRLTDLFASVWSSNNSSSPLEGWIPIVMDGSRLIMNSSCKLFSVFLEMMMVMNKYEGGIVGGGLSSL